MLRNFLKFKGNKWKDPFENLRNKWIEIPTYSSGRSTSLQLLELSDKQLVSEWKKIKQATTSNEQFNHRGWIQPLYKDMLSGKKVLDVGCGLAIDTITFAQHGGNVTFLDIAESNILLVRRLCKIFNIKNVQFFYMEELSSLKKLDKGYDVILALGSLHHAPVSIIKPEIQELLRHLKRNGRWIQLAYPKTRWIREGRLQFDLWGKETDGENTPWAEWYDLEKLLNLMKPHRFEVILYQEFHNHDFIWFDLLYKGKVAISAKKLR